MAGARALAFVIAMTGTAGASAGCGRIGYDSIEQIADCAVEPEADRCYELFIEPAPWSVARDMCESLGPTTHLATIDGPAENEAAFRFASRIPFDPAATTNQRQRMWMGGNDLAVTGDWIWITNEPFDYVNWRVGEPGSPGVEHCVIMLGSERGQWDDRPCDVAYEYLCERE